MINLIIVYQSLCQKCVLCEKMLRDGYFELLGISMSMATKNIGNVLLFAHYR